MSEQDSKKTAKIRKVRPPLDTRPMARERPTPRDYVLPGLPVGKVGMLHGWGGVSKSFWALQASYQVAAGGGCDFQLGALVPERRPGYRVAFFSFEDEPVDFHHRIYAIAQEWTRDREIAAWFWDIHDSQFVQIYPFAGEDVVLFDEDLRPTALWDEIAGDGGICEQIRGVRLIVFDTLARIHRGEENSNGQMAALLSKLEKLARRTGAAVLLVHHEGKGVQGNADAGNAAARGASALSNNSRWSARMRVMGYGEAKERWPDSSDDERDLLRREWVRLELDKTSYAPPQRGAWLRRVDGGVLVRDVPPEPKERGGRHDI